MTGIQIYRNMAGNVRPSAIARDMGAHPNAELFLRNGRPIGGLLSNGFIAIQPKADIHIPPYLRRVYSATVPTVH